MRDAQIKNPKQQKALDITPDGKEPEKPKTSFFSVLKLPLLLGLSSFIVYANTLQNGFVLDDHRAIQDNYTVTKGIPAIPRIFTSTYHQGWSSAANDNLYRPLSLTMFAVEYELFGLNPAPYHLMNILLYCCCVMLLFWFLNEFFERKKTAAAFIASLLFALHPVHTEVVGNIKSCDELLCFFFAFLSLNIFLRYAQSGKPLQLLLGGFCFLLSLFSKETAVTFIAIIPFIFFLYKNEHKKRSVYVAAAAALAVLIFFLARSLVLNYNHVNHIADIDMIENSFANQSLSSESRLATAILIMGYYVKLLLIPYPLICDYSYNSIPFTHFNDPRVLFSLLLYAFLIVYGLKRLIKNRKDPFSFGILFFLASISLFTNIPFLIGTTMAERFLFFGSAGFCLTAALLIEKWIGKTKDTGLSLLKNVKVLGIIIPICLIYAAITINRNSDWYDNDTLFKTDLAKAPDNGRLNFYIADGLLTFVYNETDASKRDEAKNEAINYLNKALMIYPNYMVAHYDMARIYSSQSKYDSAEIHFKRALQLNPKDINVIYDLSYLYFINKKYRASIELNKTAIEINPSLAIIYVNTGLAYLRTGIDDSAIYYSNKAVLISHAVNGPYEILASAYKEKGNDDSSKKYLELARINNPNFNP